MKHVKLYTTATCAFCNAEKNFLKEHNIDFEAVPVDVDAAAAEEMIKLTNQMGVPVTVVIKDDDTQEFIVGFDQPRLSQLLGIS